MQIEIGPTGALIKGSVLDVNKDRLLESIHFYDPLLYLTWNPKKRQGMGSWVLRRRPEQKTAVYQCEYQGIHIYSLEYKELDVENHVFDLPVLDYTLLNRIKKADMWVRAGYDRSNQDKIERWTKALHDDEDNYRSEQDQKLSDDLLYNLKQNRSALAAYKQAILSGTNPADIAKYWK